MTLSKKGQQRLAKLQQVEKLIIEAKEDWNPVTASSKANKAKEIIEQEAVGILKDAIIVIDHFEQELANGE